MCQPNLLTSGSRQSLPRFRVSGWIDFSPKRSPRCELGLAKPPALKIFRRLWIVEAFRTREADRPDRANRIVHRRLADQETVVCETAKQAGGVAQGPCEKKGNQDWKKGKI
jgi:hypothetical protein